MYFLLVLTILAYGISHGRSQTCDNSLPIPECVKNLPEFCDPTNNAPVPVGVRNQVLVTDYEFTCCGMVTEWGTHVQPGGSMHTNVYIPTFQVWRPLGNGVYKMVEENYYGPDPVTIEDGGRLRVDAKEPFVHFEPGDVLGYYLDTTESDNDDGVQAYEGGTEQLHVYYGTQVDGMFTLTDNTRVTSNTLAPIIYVNIQTSSCTSSIMVTSTLADMDIVSSTTVTPENNKNNTVVEPQPEDQITTILVPSLLAAFTLGVNVTVLVLAIGIWILKKKSKERRQREDFVVRLSEVAEPFARSGREVSTKSNSSTHNTTSGIGPNHHSRVLPSAGITNTRYFQKENSFQVQDNDAYGDTGIESHDSIGRSNVYDYVDNHEIQRFPVPASH